MFQKPFGFYKYNQKNNELHVFYLLKKYEIFLKIIGVSKVVNNEAGPNVDNMKILFLQGRMMP